VRGYTQDDGKVTLTLIWLPDGSDAMDFVVRVSAVDAAGNAGDPTDIQIAAEDEIDCEAGDVEGEGGCAAGGLRGSGAVWLLAALAALFVLRGRRSRAIARRDPRAL
jgi:hypothetical protein